MIRPLVQVYCPVVVADESSVSFELVVELERWVETEYTADFVVFDDSGMETVTFVVVA